MRIQPIPISPTFTFTAFTPTVFTPTTFIGSPTALIAIARTSRDGDGWKYRHRYGYRDGDGDGDRDRYWDVVPIELPRLLVFGDEMEVDDVVVDDAGGDDGDGDVDCDVDVDEDSDSESTTSSTTSTSSITSTTSHISDISSMTSVSSSSSIAKSSPAAAGVVYVPPPMRMYKLSTESTTKSSPKSGLDSESEFEYESSIPSHRLPSRFQHSSKFYPIPKSQSKSSVSVCRYKYQGGETGVMTGGVMLGSTTRSPFTPTPARASTRSPFTPTRPTLARPTKRGTARTLILGPDSSSLDWRRPRVPSLLV